MILNLPMVSPHSMFSQAKLVSLYGPAFCRTQGKSAAWTEQGVTGACTPIMNLALTPSACLLTT